MIGFSSGDSLKKCMENDKKKVVNSGNDCLHFLICRIWALTFTRPVHLLTTLIVKQWPLELDLSQQERIWRSIWIVCQSVSTLI